MHDDITENTFSFMLFSLCRLVIRICADDIDAKYRLGSKYGCSVAVGKALLNTALSLDLQVVGVW